MRIFTATLGTETNTFSPIPTGRGLFEQTMLYRAGEHPDEPTLFTAPLWVARQKAKQNNWFVAEGLCAFAQPAGITTRSAYESLRDELLDDLRKALPVDVVLLGMHGAMVADGYDDCEGDLMARVREIAGEKAVIGAELDPHCHITPLMLEKANVILCFKEYPHIDGLERAEELLDICVRAARGEINPRMATFDTRMIGMYHTPREPMKAFVQRMKDLEGRDGVLSVSLGHGFPWGDVAEMGTKVLVVADGDEAKAAAVARTLGGEITALRGKTGPQYLTVDQALDLAAAAPEGPIVLADTADNAGGGAPSDSTFVLKAILERGLSHVGLAPMWDPVVVQFCIDAGVGARLPVRLGGKTGPVSGDPLDLEIEVLAIARDARQSFGVNSQPIGDTVAVRILGHGEAVDVVINSIRCQAFNPDLFTCVGIDPAAKRIVVVKSSQHFYAGFAPLAKAVHYIGGPGAIDADLASIPFKNIRRPLWPVDAAAS